MKFIGATSPQDTNLDRRALTAGIEEMANGHEPTCRTTSFNPTISSTGGLFDTLLLLLSVPLDLAETRSEGLAHFRVIPVQ